MSFKEPALSTTLGGAHVPDAAIVLARTVDPKRRGPLRAALDAAQPVRPEVAALATTFRALRLRGFRPDDVDALCSVIAPTDATEVAECRDHAWAIGTPEHAEGEDGVSAAVGPAGKEIDIDDLFGGAPAVAEACRLAAAIGMVSTDLPALVVLSLFSAACARKVIGRMQDAHEGRFWTGPPSLYVCAEVASGEGKSLVRDLLAGASLDRRAAEVKTWHAELAEADGSLREWAEQRKGALCRTLQKLAMANDPTAREDAAPLTREVAKLREDLARPAPREPSWLQWGKVTPENFIRQAQAGGFMALFPDEGKSALAAFLGEAGGKEYIDPLLSGFSGAAFTHETISGEQRGDRSKFNRFRVVMFLPIQPGVLSPATQQDGAMLSRLASRGLLARLLIARPRRATSAERPALRKRSREVGADAETVSRVQVGFENRLAAVLHADGQVGPGAPGEADPTRAAEEALVGRPHPLTPARPWVFDFDEEARAALIEYQDTTTDSAAPGGPQDRPGIAELVRRLADHAHRLATLLAVMRTGGIVGGGTVTLADVQRAIRFLDGYVVPHAEGVYQRAIFDPIGDDGEVVLAMMRKRGECSLRELQRRLPSGGRGWGKVKGGDRQTRLEVAVEALVSHGHLIVEATGRGSRTIRVVGT